MEEEKCIGYFYPLLVGWKIVIAFFFFLWLFVPSFSLSHCLTSSTKTLILSHRNQIMDADSSWTARLSSASRRYQAALQSRSGPSFFSFVFAFPQFLKPNFKFLKFFSFVDTTSSVRTYHGVILISDCGFFDYILRIDLKLNTSREKIAMLVDYVWKLFSAVNYYFLKLFMCFGCYRE